MSRAIPKVTRIAAALGFGAALLSRAALAGGEVTVEITNLTNGTWFTPLLVAVHDPETHLFQAGEAAGAHLQAMAEGGDISLLQGDLDALGAPYAANPAGGALAPGGSTSATVATPYHPYSHLSLVAMLVPTNDGFVGLDGLPIPLKPGTYVHYLNAYDAGTEANDEIVNGGGAPGTPGVPGDPGGNNGINASGAAGPDANDEVHIHPGVIGDDDPTGGISDLDRTIHRWQNPIAKVVITVKEN